MSEAPIVVTEQENEVTRNIDISGASGIRQSDAQLFSGWGNHVGLFDQLFLDAFDSLVSSLVPLAKSTNRTENNRVEVIIAGAGTSGRLAHFCACAFNKLAKKINSNFHFTYLMAGGDLALIKSQEKAEDDVQAAETDLLHALSPPPSHCVYIGITCGLSAPYVGAHIDFILNKHDKHMCEFTTVLMGFNEVRVARQRAVEGWDKTMRNVIDQLHARSLEKESRCFILNPIVGPESITGSSRMKGGSATKILIEALVSRLFSVAYSLPLCPDLPLSVLSSADIFHAFERTMRYTYLTESSLSRVIQAAGDSLIAGGRILYLSEAPISLLGVIDASECPPTFGATFTDVRGYVLGGWEAMENANGDLSHVGDAYHISDVHFVQEILPTLTANDLVVVMEQNECSRLADLIGLAKRSSKDVKIARISWIINGKEVQSTIKGRAFDSLNVEIRLPSSELLEDLPSLTEFSAKLIFNAVSTGAHILKGKIYQNIMIDVRISNNKLYYRGANIIAKLMKIDPKDAEEFMLRSIHHVDELTSEIRAMPVSQHYAVAVKTPFVIPTSMLLASGKFTTVASAHDALKREPVLRRIVMSLLPS